MVGLYQASEIHLISAFYQDLVNGHAIERRQRLFADPRQMDCCNALGRLISDVYFA